MAINKDVMLAIQMSHKEQELQELEREIRRCEAIINSVNIKSIKYKEAYRKELILLAKKRDKLAQEITESIFLDR